MLTKSEVEFIQARRDKKEAMTSVEKQKSYRIRKKALMTIEDLTYLAENLPEKQISQIFTNDILIPFFKSIFHRREADRKRIRKIILGIVGDVLGDQEFALRMVPEDAKRLISNTDNPIELVEALFFTSMNSE